MAIIAINIANKFPPIATIRVPFVANRAVNNTEAELYRAYLLSHCLIMGIKLPIYELNVCYSLFIVLMMMFTRRLAIKEVELTDALLWNRFGPFLQST